MDDLFQPSQPTIYDEPGPSPSTSSFAPHVTFAMPEYYPSSQGVPANGGPIRRRRFNAAKIQPTRIKKVMQSDEEIGRMVASVPVAIGRAMEHFAEKFLLASAAITQNSNCRTLTPAHMKMAMAANPHFRFLETALSNVPISVQRPGDLPLPAAFNPNPMEEAWKQSPMIMSPMTNPGSIGTPLEVSSPVPTSPMVSSPMVSSPLMASPHMMGNGFPFINTMPSVGHSPATNGYLTEAPKILEPPVIEKPKRGRPRKVKKEDKCLDEEMCREVTDSIVKEDKDRELMPPPPLPISVLARTRTKQVA